MKAITAIIPVAAESPSMRSRRQKALHEICGKSMLEWVFHACEGNIEHRPIVVAGFDARAVETHVGERAHIALQTGTLAQAILSALSGIEQEEGYVLLIHGNLPLLDAGTVGMLVDAAEGEAASRLVYCEEDEETRTCPCYCFEIGRLRCFLQQEATHDAMAEHCIRALRMEGERVVDVYAPAAECLGVRDREDLWQCTCLRQSAINARHMYNGVTFIDPGRAYIDADVTIGEDTVVYPGVFLQGDTRIGCGCTIYDGCRLQDTIVGDGCELASVVAQEAAIEDGTSVGPFVRLRPNAHLGKGCKIGNFVEVKNATLGEGGKVAHLTYVGDADIGKRINIGCGTAFANYDGARKHRTAIGDDVFLGCNTSLVAPVKLGDRAYTAAGSTITKDVPADALGIGRARQANLEGWVSPKRKKEK